IAETHHPIEGIHFSFLQKEKYLGRVSGKKRLRRSFQRYKRMILKTLIDGDEVFIIVLTVFKFFFQVPGKSAGYFFVAFYHKSVYGSSPVFMDGKFYFWQSLLRSGVPGFYPA